MNRFEDYLALTAIGHWDWKSRLYDVLISLAAASLVPFVIHLFGLYSNFLIILLGYILVVLVCAATRGFSAALVALLLAFFSFDLLILPFTPDLPSVNMEKSVIFLCVLIITSLLGITYSVSHVIQRAKRQALEMGLLYKLMKDIDVEENLAAQLQIIATAIVRVFDTWGVRECSFLEKDVTDGLLLRAEAPQPTRFKHIAPDEESSILQAMYHGRLVILHDAPSVSSSLGNTRIHFPIAKTRKGRALSRFVYISPLKRGQQVIGCLRLVIEGNLGQFEGNNPQAVFFRTFLDQAMSVIERIHLRDEKSRAEMWQHTDELRKSLIDSVSHDLRTPLSKIKIAADNMHEIGIRQDDEPLQRHASSIQKEADRLDRFIRDLLDMSSIEGKTLRLEKVLLPIDEMIYNVQERMQPLLQNRLEIHLPDDLPPVKVEPTRIEQVLTNILENALRYTPTRSPIEINVQVEGKDILVSIADRGPGIAPAYLNLIFDKFYRVRKAQCNRMLPAGSGLGLAICKGIIEAHGGQIWAANREGGGAIFSFTLPLPSAEVEVHAQEGLMHSYC